MSHRKERLAHFIRDVVSDAISNRIADPRVHPFTSVTRVEVSPDLRNADVFLSVMGSESESRTTLRGMNSARGMIQTRLAKQVKMRQCPLLRFELDDSIKTAINTIQQIDQLQHDRHPGIEQADDDDEDTAEKTE